MKTFLLEIYTPYGKYLDRYVNELVIQTEEYVLGILPNHTPLVAKVKTSKMEIVQNGEKKCYAIAEGLLNVKKDGVVLLVDSIESKEEIDIFVDALINGGDILDAYFNDYSNDETNHHGSLFRSN